LSPIPFAAKDFGNGCSPFVPVLINDLLNVVKILLANASVSDGNGQHIHCIPERKRRRQQKMKKSEKNFGRGKLTEKAGDFWVETKINGLKISEILAPWTY
jgi:hypothetical protein